MKLCRWEYAGSSAGFWMVRELPATIIFSVRRGWKIECGVDLFDGFEGDAERVWGRDWEDEVRPLGAVQDPVYATRAQALAALEMDLFPASSDSLAELLV